MTSNQETPWLGWFFFPWIPYLHEISGLSDLSLRRRSNRRRRHVQPVMANPAIYSLNFINSTAARRSSNAISSENADPQLQRRSPYSLSSTNSQGVLIQITGGGPFGNLIYTGSWLDWQGPNKHNTGPFRLHHHEPRPASRSPAPHPGPSSPRSGLWEIKRFSRSRTTLPSASSWQLCQHGHLREEHDLPLAILFLVVGDRRILDARRGLYRQHERDHELFDQRKPDPQHHAKAPISWIRSSKTWFRR